MFDQRKDHQLEELLDTVLSEYSAVSPRPGLELRILAGVRARTAQRRRSWMFVFATTSAAVVIAGLATNCRSMKSTSSDRSAKVLAVAPSLRNGRETSAPKAGLIGSSPVRSMWNSSHARNQDRANPPDLLEVVDAMHGEGRPSFQQEKLYLHPGVAQDLEPATEEETAAPSISIRKLGVEPIAIKELAAEKETDKEGKL